MNRQQRITAIIIALGVIGTVVYWIGSLRMHDDPRVFTTAKLSVVGDQIKSWAVAHSRLPSNEEGLEAIFREAPNPDSARRAATDVWGQPFVYRLHDVEGKMCAQVYSLGPNGRDDSGTSDDIVEPTVCH